MNASNVLNVVIPLNRLVALTKYYCAVNTLVERSARSVSQGYIRPAHPDITTYDSWNRKEHMQRDRAFFGRKTDHGHPQKAKDKDKGVIPKANPRIGRRDD